MNDTFRTLTFTSQVLTMDPTAALRTPTRWREAVKQAQKEDWLSMPDRLIFCNILEKDVAVIDAYAGLDRDNEDFCRMWIQHKVDAGKDIY